MTATRMPNSYRIDDAAPLASLQAAATDMHPSLTAAPDQAEALRHDVTAGSAVTIGALRRWAQAWRVDLRLTAPAFNPGGVAADMDRLPADSDVTWHDLRFGLLARGYILRGEAHPLPPPVTP